MAATILDLGCAAHVHIGPPPPTSAPVEVRRAWFEAHRATRPERQELVLLRRGATMRPMVIRPALRLENGLRIVHVEDLAAVVPPGGDAARAIARAVEARDRSRLLSGLGAGLGSAGVLAGAAMVVTWIGFTPPDSPDRVPPLLLGGIASTAAGAVVGGTLIGFGAAAADEELDARARVFATWNDALRARLALDIDASGPNAPPRAP